MYNFLANPPISLIAVVGIFLALGEVLISRKGSSVGNALLVMGGVATILASLAVLFAHSGSGSVSLTTMVCDGLIAAVASATGVVKLFPATARYILLAMCAAFGNATLVLCAGTIAATKSTTLSESTVDNFAVLTSVVAYFTGGIIVFTTLVWVVTMATRRNAPTRPIA